MNRGRDRGHGRSAFTLVELLVVVAIMTLLMAILVPAVSKARESARKITCKANLHSIGQAIRTYMDEHHGYYPPMAPLPTEEPNISQGNPRPAMCDVLSPHVGGQKKVFRCASDRIRDSAMAALAQGKQTYFVWQGSSYEPRTGLSVVDPTGRWLLSREGHELAVVNSVIQQLMQNASQIVLIHEYEAFHSSTGNDEEGRNALFADFHADSITSVDQ